MRALTSTHKKQTDTAPKNERPPGHGQERSEIAGVPNETVKAVGFEGVIGLDRDEDAEAMAEFEDRGDPQKTADDRDDQSEITNNVAVDSPAIETIESRRQPRENNDDDGEWDEDPSTGGIFAPANSETAASGKTESDAASQRENDEAGPRWMSKKSCPITPTPDDQRQERQRPADSKNEVLNGLIWHWLGDNEAPAVTGQRWNLRLSVVVNGRKMRGLDEKPNVEFSQSCRITDYYEAIFHSVSNDLDRRELRLR
jgi:hypothetical protein